MPVSSGLRGWFSTRISCNMGLYATFLTVYCTHTDTFSNNSNNEVSPWLGLWISMATGFQSVILESEELHWFHLVCECVKTKNSMKWAEMTINGLTDWKLVCVFVSTGILFIYLFIYLSYWFSPTALNNLFLGRQVWLSEISVSDHVQYSEWGLVLSSNQHFHEMHEF